MIQDPVYKKKWQTTDRNNGSVIIIEEEINNNKSKQTGLLVIEAEGSFNNYVDVKLSTRAEESLYKLLQKRYEKRNKVNL